MELRSPDPACNPYLAIGLILAAGLDGLEQRMELCAPVNRHLFELGPEEPATLEEAVEAAQNSPFLAKYLPEGLAQRYYQQQLRRCAELREAADPAEFERARYFSAI